MAAIQASSLAASRLTNSLSVASSVSSSTSVDCKAWTTRRSSAQRRSLTIRATSSQEKPAAPGVSGAEVPLGGGVSTAPLTQKDIPKAERIAYVCSACGYIYDLDQPFEEQPDTYACPVCTAPKGDFQPSNASLGEGVYDTTKNADASS